jgi:hypothetical protein
MLGTMLVKAAPLLFVSVAANGAEVVCAEEAGKLRSGVNETVLAGSVPMPRRVAFCGEPAALSATESTAEKPVAEDGVNVT